MNLELFLKILISKLESESIRYCILRNYETLPKVLEKGDIDILIFEKDIFKIHDILDNIKEIHVIGVTKRKYVHNFFIYNIDKGGKSRALQLDFVFKYIYKGVSYIDVHSVLNNSRKIDNNIFYIPQNFDEVFLVFFPYYLSTGTLNNKYKNEIISIIKNNKSNFFSILKKIGLENGFINNFYNAIIQENNLFLKNVSNQVKSQVLIKNFKILFFIKYFLSEIKLRLPFKNCFYLSVKLNPKLKKEVEKSLDAFAKNIVFIDKNKISDFFKIFKIQTTFSMYMFYDKNFEISSEKTLKEINFYILNKHIK